MPAEIIRVFGQGPAGMRFRGVKYPGVQANPAPLQLRGQGLGCFFVAVAFNAVPCGAT
jgi:hypothetical protein